MLPDRRTFWLTLGALLIGFAFGFASTQFRFFEIDYKIAIIEVVSLFSSIAIGIYVATRITSQHSAKRFLVELLVEDYRGARKSIDEISKLIVLPEYEHDRIVPMLKEVAIKIASVEDIAGASGLLDKNRFEGYQSIVKRLRRLLTTNSKPQSKIYCLKPEERRSANVELSNLRSELTKMLLEINRR
jgi:predicted acetyltransferase